MSDDPFVIPAERLPPGFAEALEVPRSAVVEPKPAATVVLLRAGSGGMEVLLLKRHRSVGFVPGAYVFPGGRIDDADSDARLLEGVAVPERGGVPAHYWFGAVREVFEETGVLLARDAGGGWAPDTSGSERLERWRSKLMANQAHLIDVITAEDVRVVLDDVVYFAHWITPEAEPRRYDTRFFAAALPPERVIRPDPRETVDMTWATPARALEQFAQGQLPMVFPTVRTLQELAAFATVESALDALKLKQVEPVLPRLVRSSKGVGIVIDPKEEANG